MATITGICGLVLGFGCKKNLLDTAPSGPVSTITAWTTDALTDQGVNGVYAALRQSNVVGGNGLSNSSYTGSGLYTMDVYSQNTQSLGGAVELNYGVTTTAANLFAQTWQQLYEGISRANDAIAHIPEKSPSDPRKKARYMAECKFLRAYFYFRLNQVFQGVPVYLEPTAFDQFTKPRCSADSVWNVVIGDLSAAINEEQLPQFYPAGDGAYGHITKGAAYALRGKVYMYQKKWDLAIADFERVKAAGYGIFTGAGANSYRMLFKEANEQCAEMIFSMQNISQPGYGGDIPFYCGSAATPGQGLSFYCATPDLADLYENIDGSAFDWNQVIPGYNQMRPAAREVYFLRDHATAAELQAAASRGATVSQYLPDGNEARILRAYTNRDLRLNQTIITPYATYQGRLVGQPADQTLTFRWPFRDDKPPVQDLQLGIYALSYCFYGYRKFVPEGSEAGMIDQSPVDFPIIRYAEVALLWAEALNEKNGVSQEAIDLVNQVRSRAGIALLQQTNAALPTFVGSPEALRNRIRNEFRVEFPNEGIDYFNQLRWHTLKEAKFTSQNGVRVVWGSVLVPYVWTGDQLYTWPVPLSVVQMNPAITKTPGWVY
ncbi:RagB/SusD family nutrient uptake outer membrane protein [Niabella sp.]|uniref:RagB/SusD family nutrient uptake outer membrane protein n=1 Tax=Niabella sp. TaxID=1962976 RepID=UPI002626F8FF|nr:RagB/SusD family nutrient uptake outer membrane protein [Niabella sp.]